MIFEAYADSFGYMTEYAVLFVAVVIVVEGVGLVCDMVCEHRLARRRRRATKS